MRSHAIVLFLAFAFACGSQPASNEHSAHTANSAADHNMMAHANAANSNSGNANASSGHTMDSSPGAASAPYELQFLDSMAVHHQDAIRMSELAETRALHPEIKEMAANIIDVQERENAKMSEWRDRWFAEKGKAVNMDFPGMRDSMGRMDMKKLESLKGNDFDLEFLRQMIAHHEGAVKMAKDAQKIDSHAEIKELADNIIAAQTDEIRQMREWLAEWSRQ